MSFNIPFDQFVVSSAFNAAIAVSVVAILASARRSWIQRKVEIQLSDELFDLAQKRRAISRLLRLQYELRQEKQISKSLQRDFDKLLEDAICHLQNSERKYVRYGIEQPSPVGKRSYELKLISIALSRHLAETHGEAGAT